MIGERWRVGDELVLEVTSGRIPCRTFASWLGEKGWVKRFTQDARARRVSAGRSSPARSAPGDPIEIVHRPDHEVTVELAFRAETTERTLLPQVLAAGDALHPEAAERAGTARGEYVGQARRGRARDGAASVMGKSPETAPGVESGGGWGPSPMSAASAGRDAGCMSRLKRVLIILTTVAVVIGLALGGAVRCGCTRTPRCPRSARRLQQRARHTAAREVDGEERRHPGLRPDDAGRADGVPARAEDTHLGVQRAAYLGPTLRAERGEKVAGARSRTRLGEASTVHWHGMHLPAAMDGGPHQMVAPGATWTPALDRRPARRDALVPPASARRDRGARAARAGRACSSSTTTRSAAAALPHEYGVDDLPVIVQDVASSARRSSTTATR